jgi:uncharacterized protein (TIGR02145 family)
MKKVIVLIVFLQLGFRIFAQDLTIFFQPKVTGTPIDSILATNLTTNQVVKLLGGESLLLLKTPTGIHPLLEINETGYIYPNPATEDATFCYSMEKSEEVEIGMYNTNGQLLKQNRLFLEQGTHRFELKFPAAGIYFLSVLNSESTASFKAVYTGGKIQTGSIQYAGSEKLNSQKTFVNQLKSTTTNKTVNYTDGDFIQYSVFSGLNTTLITETPTVSKAFDVEFVNCIDKDGKSYKVVQIGSQWWMTENLAYLPAVSPPSEGSTTSPYYYVYDYKGTNVTTAKATINYITYGVLYNWSAALAACPPGWHLPSDSEWKQLEMALGMTQAEANSVYTRGTDQGAQMKATSGWNNNGNGNNTSGFSGLPGGWRLYDGNFKNIGYAGFWRSSSMDSEYLTDTYMSRSLSYITSKVNRGNNPRDMGLSVRCVKD